MRADQYDLRAVIDECEIQIESLESVEYVKSLLTEI
jgi:hypothetical protein